MQQLHFSITISAPVEKVWDTMLNQDTYRIWTKSFSPNGYYEGDWNQGSSIRFLAKNEEGHAEGMVSRIKENRLHEYVSIEHLGFIKDGVEDTTSDKIKGWVGALENYTFKQEGETTHVLVDIDVEDSFVEEFSQMWPKALESLKQLVESR